MRSGASNEIQIGARGLVDPAVVARADHGNRPDGPGSNPRGEGPRAPSLLTPFAGLISRPAERVGGGFLPLATRRRAHPCKAFCQGAVSHGSGRDRADHLFARAGGVGLGLQASSRKAPVQGIGRPLLHVHFTRPHARPASRNAGNMPEPKMGLTMQNLRSLQCPAF